MKIKMKIIRKSYLHPFFFRLLKYDHKNGGECMNKKIVVGGVIVAAVVAGGVGYGVTHTAKAQFASHMLSICLSRTITSINSM